MDGLDRIRGRAHARARGAYRGFEHVRPGVCFVQGDQNIANQAGAAFRSDLNNELQALVTFSQGAAAPGTTYRNMLWHDTTANLIKQRNAANAAWIVKATLDETFVLSRASNTILGLSDIGKPIVCTSTFTQTITAAATLGDGWYCDIRNDGTGIITLDPNGAETVNGVVTFALFPGESGRLVCNGSAFKLIGIPCVRVVAKSGAAVSAPADTNEDTLATVTLPANTLRANGRIEIHSEWTITSNGNNKTPRIKFGGTSYYSSSSTANPPTSISAYVQNRNATNSQVGVGTFQGASYVDQAQVTTAVDTTADVTILITAQKASAGDTMTLESYRVVVFTDGN